MKSWSAIDREEGQHRRYLRKLFLADSLTHVRTHSVCHHLIVLAGSLPFYLPNCSRIL